MLAQYVLCSPVCVHLSVCLTVRLSITSRHGAKMAKHRITQTTPHISPRHSILLKFEGVTPTWAPITLLTTTYEVTFCSHCFLTVELTVMHCAISDMTSYYPADSIHQLTPIFCDAIRTSNGVAISWVNELLGVFILRSRNFKCSPTNTKKSFYRSANAIFGKIGRITTEEATLELISSKCTPVLIYGLEACPLLKSDISSLEFVVNRFFKKLFRTSSIDVVKQCQYRFDSVLRAKRVQKFEAKFYARNNLICKINV